MTSNNIIPATLVYNGEVIRDKGEMLSLTDMWKASGSDDGKRPAEWLRLDATRAFVEVVEASNMGVAHISTRRGNNGGTHAHWQIALAYAKYLSPEFHMWCNQVVRERMEGKPQPTAIVLDESARNAIGGIVKGIVLKQIADFREEVRGFMLTDDPRRAALEFVSVRELLDEAGAIQRRRNSLNRKVGCQLRNRAILMNPIPPVRRCPHSGVWLFQRDFALRYMAEHGRELVIAHNERQLGQGVLKFPRKAEKPSFDGSAL
jgi:hypothetical protein